MALDIVVVGSLSLDMVFEVARRPAKGETIKARSFQTFVGGKGNNQALAAARSGGRVAMVGRVGDDEYGALLRATLDEASVDTRFLISDTTEGTGLANIYVDPDGDNSIVIVPRANDRLCPGDIADAGSVIEQCAIILLQLEIPLKTVTAAATAAHEKGKTVVLNPAPAPMDGELPPELLACVDILIPNQSEAALMTGMEIDSQESAYRAAGLLRDRGVAACLITMGEKGVIGIDSSGNKISQPAFAVQSIDTTAAGDAFCGALVHKLADGADLASSMRYAAAAGALATTRAGAAPSLPSRAEIEGLISKEVNLAR